MSETTEAAGHFDVDWAIVGSGFGGSVSALRLAERGYSVHVLECGRRFAADDLPETTWHLRDYFWAPQLGLRGILRMSMFRDVAILSGCGVGGGSLVYAHTLYRATDGFRERFDRAVGDEVDLDPFYDVAERMLGVVDQARISSRDRLVKSAADDFGHRVHPTRVGAFRGEPGRTVPDPFFGGEGPDRTGCIDCGQCLAGCRHNAKNTLDKNYLWLAERRGVQIEPERQVTDISPLGAADGSDGYAVTSQRPGAWARPDRRVLRARGVIVAAGPVGTNRLLARCRLGGSLPAISDQLGFEVRTNAESMCALTSRDRDADLSEGVTITSSVWVDEETHIETVAFGGVADAMSLWFVPFTGDGTRLTRPLKMLWAVLRRPRDFARSSGVRGWSRRSFGIGAMQESHGAIRFLARRRRFGKGVRLTTRQDPDHPNPTFLPKLHEFVDHMGKKHDLIPQSWFSEAALNIPASGHILGGAAIGTGPETGVIDAGHHVFGYRNLMVCDGSAVPSNPGVNPSLTITALAERAMAQVPAKDGSVHVGGIGFEAADAAAPAPTPA